MHRLHDRIDPSPLATLPRMAVRVALGAALLAVASGSASSQSSTNPAATPQHRAMVAPTFAVRVVGRGAPIILIPGLLSGADVWDGTVAHLGERYQLHIVQVAGFAGMPASSGDDFAGRLRDSLIAYARTLRGPHAERPVIVGHSLGGFVAYAMAATAPDAFDGMVAVDGVPFSPPCKIRPPRPTGCVRAPPDCVRCSRRSAVTNSPPSRALAFRGSCAIRRTCDGQRSGRGHPMRPRSDR